MKVSKNIFAISLIFIFGIGLLGGFFLAGNSSQDAYAQDSQCIVDQSTLKRIYETVFHRPLDDGANFHLGKPLENVFVNIMSSPEHTQYTALFQAMKSLEEARRVPGSLSAADEAKYLDILDSAMSTVAAWSDTLPPQSIQLATVGAAEARLAIQKAFEGMIPTAQQAAQFGLCQATERIGPPAYIPLPSTQPPQHDPVVMCAQYGGTWTGTTCTFSR